MEEMNVTTIPSLYLKQTYTKSKKRICKSLSKENFNQGMKLESKTGFSGYRKNSEFVLVIRKKNGKQEERKNGLLVAK